MASSMAQLNAELMSALRSAMNKANSRGFEQTQKDVKWFYSGGSPNWYTRTGALGNTPRKTGVSSSVSGTGGSATFSIYLDQSGGYSTGDKPGMGAVLNLANYGAGWKTKGGKIAHPTVGNKGFWERAERHIEEIFNQEVGSAFG